MYIKCLEEANDFYEKSGKNEELKLLNLSKKQEELTKINNYAFYLQHGEEITEDVEKAAKYYKIAADNGSKAAKYNYGKMLFNGEGISKNEEEALRYFKMAAIEDQRYLRPYIKHTYEYAEKLKKAKQLNKAAKYLTIAIKSAEKNNFTTDLFNIEEEKECVAKIKRIDIGNIDEAKKQLKEKLNFEFMGEKPVGEGTEGEVYKVKLEENDFALKIPKNSPSSDNSDREEEIKDISNRIHLLGGNEFVKVLDKFLYNGNLYIEEYELMKNSLELNKIEKNKKIAELKEKLEKGDLSEGERTELMKNIKKLEKEVKDIEKRALYSVTRLITSLNTLHLFMNIIHGDLKMKNTLSDNKNNIIITDFGQSSIFGSKWLIEREKKGSPVGTPLYMSPELNEDAGNSIKSDVYALGAVLYEILTGNDFLTLLKSAPDGGIDEKVKNKKVIKPFMVAKLINDGLDSKITEKNITDKINFKNLLPDVDFDNGYNENELNKLKEEMLKFFKNILTADFNKRFTTNEATIEIKKILNICQKMKKRDGSNLDLESDLGIDKMTLYNMGIINNDIIEFANDEYPKSIRSLLSNVEITLYPQTINCLKILCDCAKSEDKSMNNEIGQNFMENLNKLKNLSNAEYLLVTKKLIELKRLAINTELNKVKEQYKQKKLEISSISDADEIRLNNLNEQANQLKVERKKIKESRNMLDLIIKIKQDKSITRDLLFINVDEKTDSDPERDNLEYVCENCNPFALKVLVNSGENIKDKLNEVRDDRTLLSIAIEGITPENKEQKAEIIKILIENGADFGNLTDIPVQSKINLNEMVKSQFKVELGINGDTSVEIINRKLNNELSISRKRKENEKYRTKLANFMSPSLDFLVDHNELYV